MPCWAQVRGAQATPPSGRTVLLPPQRLARPPPPHDEGAGHPPSPLHSRRLPQPSATGPQFAPAAVQLRGMHAPVPPHWPKVPPPPQVCGVGQPPTGLQSSRPPQPSAITPHPMFAEAQVRGTQPAVPPHLLGAPPPPQVCGAVQAPQFSSPPQPSPAGPQSKASCPQVLGTQVPSPAPAPAPPPPPAGKVRPPPLPPEAPPSPPTVPPPPVNPTADGLSHSQPDNDRISAKATSSVVRNGLDLGRSPAWSPLEEGTSLPSL